MRISDLQHELAWFDEWFQGQLSASSLGASMTKAAELIALKNFALAAWEEGAKRESARHHSAEVTVPPEWPALLGWPAPPSKIALSDQVKGRDQKHSTSGVARDALLVR